MPTSRFLEGCLMRHFTAYPTIGLKQFPVFPIKHRMANNKKTMTIIPSLRFNLKEKQHQVSEIMFHYGSLENKQQDRIFKMSFSAKVEGVPMAAREVGCTLPLSGCFQILRENGNAPMASYMEKVLDSIGEVEMKEVAMLQTLSAEGFQFDAFIEGVVFSVDFHFEDLVLEEGEVWEG